MDNMMNSIFDEDVEIVKVMFTGIYGEPKMIEMPRSMAEKVLKEGYLVNRFAIGGLRKDATGGRPVAEYLKEMRQKLDLVIKPDISTVGIYPWDSYDGKVASVNCGIYNQDGTPSWLDTRRRMIDIMNRAEKMGVKIGISFDCDFYLFHTDESGRPTTLTHETAAYYDGGLADFALGVRHDIYTMLSDAGMEIESAHHGVTPGQHCFVLPYRDGVEAADYFQNFRTAVKRIAKTHGLHATFMPKPLRNGDGSGLHLNMKIYNLDGKVDNVATEQFKAGILKHMRDMMIFTNQTINSYKRLAADRQTIFQPEFPAAVWEQGSDKAVRITESTNGDLILDVQFPDPACNPYLALTAVIAAGLEGVGSGLEVQYDKNIRFPSDLGVLLKEFDKNQFAKDLFGEEFCSLYKEGKQEEWDRFCSIVTEWELNEYLPN